MERHKPTIHIHGSIAQHDMACSVLYHNEEPAVLNMGRGVFEPSWKAQRQGYYLIHANTWLKRKIYRLFFKDN